MSYHVNVVRARILTMEEGKLKYGMSEAKKKPSGVGLELGR